MNCTTCQEALGLCFDEGKSPQGTVKEHLHRCEACAAFQADLEGLDNLLAMPVVVETDDRFVARVEEAVARSSRVVFPVWARAVAAVAITLAALGGGWLLDSFVPASVSDVALWQPDLPAFPTRQQVTTELTALPESMFSLVAQIRGSLKGTVEALTVYLRAPLDQHGAFVWSACAVGVILLLLVNTRERGHLA